MTFRIDTADLARASSALDGMADRLADPSDVLALTSTQVVRSAGPRTPRRTGTLAGSVRTNTEAVTKATIRWGVPYAVYVNYGTRYMPARPFATDALTDAEAVLESAAGAWASGIVTGG